MGDNWTERLSDYLDGDLRSDERVALERHLERCGECSKSLADLESVKARAGQLEDTAPTAELWSGIAERIGGRIEPQVRDIGTERSRKRWRLAVSVPQLAAAGIMLMLLSGGAVQIFHSTRVGPDPQLSEVVAEPAPAMLLAGFDAAEYDRAIAQLERVLREGRDQLASPTVRILERNLAVIDRAIADAWEALELDPSNEYVNSHLAHTMKQKVRLLRRATNIMSASS